MSFVPVFKGVTCEEKNAEAAKVKQEVVIVGQLPDGFVVPAKAKRVVVEGRIVRVDY
jgi:hypothetical protein